MIKPSTAPYAALVLRSTLGAMFLAHAAANGSLFTNKGGGWESPGFWALSLIVLYLLGDGALTLGPGQGERHQSLAHAVASKH